MKWMFLFSFVWSLNAQADNSGVLRCEDIFPKESALVRDELLAKNYFYNDKVSDLIHRVQSLGVRIEFWDPSENGTTSMHKRYVEPLIVAGGFYDRRFLAEETTIYLPYDPAQLFGSEESFFRLRRTLIRVARIFELQRQGVLFAPGSLALNGRVTIIGIAQDSRITDPTLVALHHFFQRFTFDRASFEPRDSVWETFGFSPEHNYMTNPQDEAEVLIRMSYFERLDLWQQISVDLEYNLFAPNGQSLFPEKGSSIN